MALSLSTIRRKNGLWRLQSAMEYLMTYGWAILIIAVVLAALFELGVFNGSNLAPQACIAQAGFVCKNPVYTANGIGITFGQTTGREYFDSFMFIAAEGEPLNSMGIPQNFTTSKALSIGNLLPGQTVGADFNASKFAYGQIPANAPIGTPFAGYVWLGYCLSPCSAPTAYSKVATMTVKESGTGSAGFGGYFGGGSGGSGVVTTTTTSIATTSTLYQVEFSVSPADTGTTTPTNTVQEAPGNSITITATPDSGYIFTGWSSSTGNIVIADPSVESTTANVEGSGTVTAGFAIPYVPISLSTPGTTPAPFQQNLSVGGYSTFTYNGVTYNGINQQWSNVEFTTGPAGTGTALQAWCESGCSGSSTAIVWVRLPNGFSGSTTIYMNFMPNDVMSASGPTGEAPQLSSTYAEYDNGASVFGYYKNFAGSGLPSGWQELTSSGDTYTWDNGITFTNNGNGDYVSIGTTSAVSPSGILEVGITSGSNARPTIELATSDTQIEGGQPIYMYENGYGQSYGMYSGDMQFEILTTSYSDVANSKTAYDSPIIEGIAWTATGSQLLEIVPDYNYNNMETVSETNTAVSLSTPLYIMLGQAASGSSSDTGSFTANWLRTRAYPPNGVMPSYSFGSSVQ